MSRMPVLFIGHGSPMNALDKTPFTESLRRLGKSLPRPQAILCVSAHWETQGTQILHHATPPTIHDFYGFPKPLFDLQYPAPGSLKIAEEVQKILPYSTLTNKWGLDHGAWSVLVHLFPQADIPVFQVSIDANKTAAEHIEFGKKLSSLRDQGILILGSGNIVHNLRLLQWKQKDSALPWAVEFDNRIKAGLEARDIKALSSYELENDTAAMYSVPTPEHYQPLLYVFGASDEQDKISYPYEGFELGSLSMRSVMWECELKKGKPF